MIWKLASRAPLQPETNTDLSPLCRYYALTATCLLARKTGWLVNACLAVALIFPAVAALHGIVLAAVHVEGESLDDPIAATPLIQL